jgi:hypothetical protein
MFYCGIDVAKRKHAVVVLDDLVSSIRIAQP